MTKKNPRRERQDTQSAPGHLAAQGFARRLSELRYRWGASTGRPNLSQADFASALGITRQAYNRYEVGTTEPSLEVLIRLVRTTGVSLNALVGEPPGRDDLVTPFGAIPRSGDDTSSLGERLAVVRLLSETKDEADMASLMGVPLARWREWENDVAQPPLAFVIQYAQWFRVNLEFLLRGDEAALPEGEVGDFRKTLSALRRYRRIQSPRKALPADARDMSRILGPGIESPDGSANPKTTPRKAAPVA